MSEPAQKKQRTGVGSSVATLVRGEVDDFILVLSKIKVERLLPRGREVITTTTSEVLPEVFKKMVDNNILSLPVVNQKGKYYGVVEMANLVEYVINLFADLTSTKLVDVQTLMASEIKFTHATVRDVMKRPLTKRNPFKPIEKGYSLYTAWETLALGGVHRIPILDETSQICDIITQSMLIDFLWQNIEKIHQMADLQIKDFKAPQFEHVAHIRATTKSILAFRELVKLEKEGLAVVDEDGRLVDNLSARDLRGIHTDATVFWRLWSSVSEFKAKVRKEFSEKTPSELLYALPTDTLYSIIEKMAKQHVHRVYVVDSPDHMKPIRVVTQTDVLREILDK